MKNFPGPFWSAQMFTYKEKKMAFTYNIQRWQNSSTFHTVLK